MTEERTDLTGPSARASMGGSTRMLQAYRSRSGLPVDPEVSADDPWAQKPPRPRAPQSPRQASNPNRLSVNLSQEVADALRAIVLKRKISITEAVRRAISLLKFVEDAMDDGGKFLIARSGEEPRELIFFR
jgi:Ribbon-helix-helix protein, copG family